jgi:3-hydroxybutyryl-CoA dehydrogenase
MSDKKIKVAVAGGGAMGAGIAQVAAVHGHEVVLYDAFPASLDKAKISLTADLNKLQAKGKINEADALRIQQSILFTENLNDIKGSLLFIEAVVEQLEVKQQLFKSVEELVSIDCILATNTSSLAVIAIGSECKKQDRVMGLHFFNPPTIMQLVEVIPTLNTLPELLLQAKTLVESWGKIAVTTKDTPGFIVNRIARPYYGEAIRIYEEGIADFVTIDYAMKTIGGFKMGPFELMDFIGNDINFKVTETVFAQMFYEPRYKPSITQKRLFEGKLFGRKSGKGYYSYQPLSTPEPLQNKELLQGIFNRIFYMLVNEAAEALHFKIASAKDIELAMTKGVNYPKGLLAWANEFGIDEIYNGLKNLQEEYGEDRYRASVLLKRLSNTRTSFEI